MKDSIFNFIMITIIIFACTLCCVNEIRKHSKNNIDSYYPMNTVVREIDYDNNIVIVENNDGELFSFFGTDSFKVNDSCALLMYDNTTSDITDDVIIQIGK